MLTLIPWLTVPLAPLAGLALLGGVTVAGYCSLRTNALSPDQWPAFLATVVTAAGSVLGTKSGAVLGIRVTVRRWRATSSIPLLDGIRVAAFHCAVCLLIALAP